MSKTEKHAKPLIERDGGRNMKKRKETEAEERKKKIKKKS